MGPLQPDGQWHSKPEGTSWQEPPLAHGLEEQACSAARDQRRRWVGVWAWVPTFPGRSPEPHGGGKGLSRAPRGRRDGAQPGPRDAGRGPLPGRGHRPTPLTVLARVADGADAVVLVGLGVGAGAPVGAGAVAAAVVQVWGQARGAQGRACPARPSRPTVAEPQAGPPAACYLCRRAGRPSWSHRCTARAPRSCRARSQGTGRTRHRIGPASRSCTCGRTAQGRGAGRWGLTLWTRAAPGTGTPGV